MNIIQTTISGKTWSVRSDRHGDTDVINEIWTQDFYRLRQYKAQGFAPKVIVDIGAHIGTFAVLAHELWPNASITCLEPHPDSFDLLKLNAPFAECINAGIYYGDNDLRFVDAEGATGGGFIAPASEVEDIAKWKSESDHFVYSETDFRFTVMTLEALGIQAIGLLKIDAEVAELNIVKNISQEFADRIWMLLGEYHCEGGFNEFKTAAEKKFRFLEFYGGNDNAIGPFWSRTKITTNG